MQEEKNKQEEKKETFNIDKKLNFSEWFTEIIQKAELADLRYNLKGFLVFQPWSVLSMEEIYKLFEKELQRKNHKPLWMPTLIPEENFLKEAEHVEGFAPELFWVTQHGEEKFEQKLGLRPTSETAFYKMFSLWIRSYNDLPLKTYQRANVFRYESKATRPFLRSREFHWIESHNAFPDLKTAKAQLKEDIDTTERILHKELGIPFIFFERPQWDKFAGAEYTYAADTILPNGRTLQLPSTHLINPNFSKNFGVEYTDSNGQQQGVFTTCYGPCISRIFGALIAIHGDNKGLVFPFSSAPLQIIVIPILADKEPKVLKKAKKLKDKLFKSYRTDIDTRQKNSGEKFYFWEMKGVPIRIELGPKELEEKSLVVYRRDTNKKEKIKESQLSTYLKKAGKEINKNLIEQADKKFTNIITNANNLEQVKEIIESKGFARVPFCTLQKTGEKCAEKIEKDFSAKVRGKRVDIKEKPKGNCIVCGKPAKVIAYIGKEY